VLETSRNPREYKGDAESVKGIRDRKRRAGGVRKRGEGRKRCIVYIILTHAHTNRMRAAVTSLGNQRQRWQVGTPLS